MTRVEMDCRRAEELLSDHVEGLLEQPLLGELDGHLASCPACRELRGALHEVVLALKGHPVLEPADGLAERAALAALRRPAPVSRATFSWRFRGVPWGVQAAAAVLAVFVTGGVLLASGGAAHLPTRVRDRAVNAGTYLAERKDRLVENFRILRVVVATAFGSRVDRLGDRVEDYKKRIEQKKTTAPEPKKTNGSRALDHGPRFALGPRISPNLGAARLVTTDDAEA